MDGSIRYSTCLESYVVIFTQENGKASIKRCATIEEAQAFKETLKKETTGQIRLPYLD